MAPVIGLAGVGTQVMAPSIFSSISS
ncbi:hypothetical protein HNP02_000542 [Mycobacterium sp. AZCC_0083]|nr:hypothetical protein [Mycobacterium sp. AZCC_0083]